MWEHAAFCDTTKGLQIGSDWAFLCSKTRASGEERVPEEGPALAPSEFCSVSWIYNQLLWFNCCLGQLPGREKPLSQYAFVFCSLKLCATAWSGAMVKEQRALPKQISLKEDTKRVNKETNQHHYPSKIYVHNESVQRQRIWLKTQAIYFCISFLLILN